MVTAYKSLLELLKSGILDVFTKVISCVWSKGLFLKFDVAQGMLCS